MIYACHRSAIPEDRPEGSACVMPAVCDICRQREPYDRFASIWYCETCLRPFILGFTIGAFMERGKAVQRSLEARE